MAKVVVIEPHDEVRELIVRIVARLGHEPVRYRVEADLAGADILLVEPAATDGLRQAQSARSLGVAVIFVSIFPPSDETRAVEPIAFLHKPFTLVDLEHAIVGALAPGRRLAAV